MNDPIKIIEDLVEKRQRKKEKIDEQNMNRGCWEPWLPKVCSWMPSEATTQVKASARASNLHLGQSKLGRMGQWQPLSNGCNQTGGAGGANDADSAGGIGGAGGAGSAGVGGGGRVSGGIGAEVAPAVP